MTTPSPGGPSMTGHALLLRLAGRIPDDLLSGARRRLAEGDIREAMRALTGRLAEEPVPLLAGELAAMRVLAADPGALPDARPAAELPELPFAFRELDPFGGADADAMDDAVAAVAEGHGVAGLWRTWRYRIDDPDADQGAATVTIDPDDPGQAYRVYIVQVEQANVSRALCRDLLRAIDDMGRAGAEVILPGDEPSPYQDMALAKSLLLWASQGEPEFDLAAVFDFADPVTGPGFVPDHAVIDDAYEREQMLDYLRSGALVLATTAAMDDILDPAAGAVVPMSFRTDGRWIWTDAVEYYLSRYGLAPDAGLDEHIRQQLSSGELVPLIDEQTACRAADFLLNPPLAEPDKAVWLPGTQTESGGQAAGHLSEAQPAGEGVGGQRARD
jgi:hypothetical protein